MSIPTSGVFRALMLPTLFFTGLAVLAGLYFTAQQAGHLTGLLVFNFGIIPFSLTGSALSFLLVFRTNTSYRRWLEARRMFGSVLTKSRDLFRQCLASVASQELKNAVHRWLLAFYWYVHRERRRRTPHFPLTRKKASCTCVCRFFVHSRSLKSMVRMGEECDLMKRVEGVMEPDELQKLLESPRAFRPHFCLNVLSRIIQQADLQPSLISMMGAFACDLH